MPRYFLDLPRSGRTAWDPHDGPRPELLNTRYFGPVLVAMERVLRDRDVDVYLTQDTKRLPAYGPRVVAVVVGDEVGRVPRYGHRVRAVFTDYGTRPTLGAGPLRDPSLAGLGALAQYGLRWLRWLPGGLASVRRRAAVSVIPVGTFNQLELPVVPIEERRTDLFFAGSLEHGRSLRQRVGTPKPRARREMLAAVGGLRERRPDLVVEVRLTEGFRASEAASAEDYSRALMDARVCLAPRGTSVETFRVFEGLRAGCLVVAERLPRHWFYAGGPIVQLDRWRDLERALAPLLDDPAALRARHEASLAWWRERCSEEAVGRFMARRIDAAAR